MTNESKPVKIKVKKQDWCFTKLGITVQANSYPEALEELKKVQAKGKK